MKENRDDIKSKLYYMDEILHKISSMSQAENEKQLDDMTPSILKSIGKYTAADRAIRGSGKKEAEMIPIIAMTANVFAEDKRKTMEAGMDAHLSKPLNVPELMETIRKFCAGKKMCQ